MVQVHVGSPGMAGGREAWGSVRSKRPGLGAALPTDGRSCIGTRRRRGFCSWWEQQEVFLARPIVNYHKFRLVQVTSPDQAGLAVYGVHYYMCPFAFDLGLPD